ncbi:MAG: NUDIX domain-containing protein [Anaerolineales bacterium]|nr:NUDIX domain-containing protein [Anaerolineales bacterium]
MENIIPIIKKKIKNNESSFEWRFGGGDTNIVLENIKLNVKLLRYIITSAGGEFLYDTFSIKEPENNTVILVRNQNNEIGLVWEWRPVPAKWFWACPRGFGDPNDEDNIATAKRETIEEIGQCEVISSRKIGSLYQNTTFFENPVGLVLLDVEVITSKMSQEEGILDFKFFNIDEIKNMVREDKIEDTFTLSALMRYFAL